MTESRRRFLVHSATAGGGLAVMSAADLWAAQSAPTDRIGIGVIGCNGMGFADLQSLLKRPRPNVSRCATSTPTSWRSARAKSTR